MSFYPDLSPYTYNVKVVNSHFLNIGWLDAKHPFATGSVDEAFLGRLWAYCQKSVNEFRGFHDCDFCDTIVKPVTARRNDEELQLGSAEIRVPGKNGIVYIAPNLIYHYVTVHHYQPPAEFIDAIIHSPHPSSSEYINFLDQQDVDYQFLDREGEIIAAGGSYKALAASEKYRAALRTAYKKS